MLEKDPMWASMDHVNWIQSRDLNRAVLSFRAGLLKGKVRQEGVQCLQLREIKVLASMTRDCNDCTFL